MEIDTNVRVVILQPNVLHRMTLDMGRTLGMRRCQFSIKTYTKSVISNSKSPLSDR